MALVIVILVLLLTVVFFYLKCTMMQSFMTLASAVLATIIAFSYYEWAANFLISRGYGLDWALCGCFVVLFIAVFAVFRSLSEFLIAASIDLGNAVKLLTALVCGLLTGILLSGNLLVALGLLPMHGKVFYSQFDPDAPVVLSSPKTSASTDGFVSSLYRHISSGSMSSAKSFGVFHADYLSQVHLNKLKIKDQVLSVCSREALVLPEGKTRKPVRRKTVGDQMITLVRIGVQAKKIKDGGANDATGKIAFFPAQIRLITKKDISDGPLAGMGNAIYPVGIWTGSEVKKWELDEIVTPNPKTFKDRVYWTDVAFQCPTDEIPVLLQFKQNAVVKLPAAVVSTPEIEQALDSEEQEEESL